MTESDPIIELLATWEERRRLGEVATPEELCPHDEELRETLRLRIARRQRLLQQIDVQAGPADEAAARGSLPALQGYELLGLIGSGGMGVVYKARHVELDRIVAVKMLHSGRHSSPSELARFRAEAATVAKLQHANIVQIFEIGEHNGQPFLVLEYVQGGTLADLIRGTPVAPHHAARMISSLAISVEHAHRAGIVHRDLKPGNILIADGGSLKVTDFGLAKRLDHDQTQTRTGIMIGTPRYMAPEQVQGRSASIGPTTDVYALGVMLYEMLTGRVPFAGETLLETLDQINTHDPVTPRQLVPKIPRDLETICLRCLEKDPQRRYSTAQELAEDLERFLAGDPIQAKSDNVLRHVTRAVGFVRHDMQYYAAWSRLFLALCPFPALLHLVLITIWGNSPYFPYAALATTLAISLMVQIILFSGTRQGFQSVAASIRRHFLIVRQMQGIAMALVLIGVWWHTPVDRAEQLFLVYPAWAALSGLSRFAFAGHFGFYHIIGWAAFTAGALMIFFQSWSPLIAGLFLTFNLGSMGVVFHVLGRSEKTPHDWMVAGDVESTSRLPEMD